MKFIIQGKSWSREELRKRLAMAEEDWAKGRQHERAYYWAIMDCDRAVGMLGFHHPSHERNYSFRIFMDPAAQGHGLGTRATLDALHAFARYEPGLPIKGAAHQTNAGGANLMLRAGFVEGPPGIISGIPVRTFLCAQPGNAQVSSSGSKRPADTDSIDGRKSKRGRIE